MASGTPRSRINQFYASKKKSKEPSPLLKSKLVEKDARIALEASPSGKGSLAGFLVTSQDDVHPAGSLQTVNCSSARTDFVKRKLELEVRLSSKDENEEVYLSGEGHCQIDKASGEAQQKKHKTSDMGDVVSEGLGKDTSDSPHDLKNPELKQFAADFLSLYCSKEVPPSAAKRQGSPSSIASEEKLPKRRHFSNDGCQYLTEGEKTCSGEKFNEQVQSNVIAKSEVPAKNFPREVIVNDSGINFQASLRKCNNTLGDMACCSTPGPLISNGGARETPKSTRGSSIFSPGETFWSEAVKIADGLLAVNKNIPVKVFEQIKDTDKSWKTRNLDILTNEDCTKQSNVVEYEGAKQICDEGSAFLTLRREDDNNIEKVVSPMPVKHFDFSSEEKLFQKEAQIDQSRHLPRADEQMGCYSTNHKLLQRTHITSQMSDELPKLHVNTAQRIVNNSIRVDDSLTSKTPNNEFKIFNSTHGCSEENTPSSFLSVMDRLDIINWLPSEICNTYRKRGISKLYPWQVDCLQVDGVLQRRNLVYCASTSAGKSFVAEILMLRRVLSTGKMALLVLPYVSICAEKAEHLEALLEPLDKHVRSYYGNQGGGTLPKDTSVAVCTIEKANSLLNRLLEEGRMSEVGIIVIDELHMVGDQNRGYLLELMLTKLRYAAGEGSTEIFSGESSGTSTSSGKNDPAHGLQIVGMSATLPNVAAVADWLQAALYQTDFRPVPLVEYIKVGNTIYNKGMEIIRTIGKGAELGGKDPDHIVELCNEVVQEGHSVLLFCSSRKGCESTATHIAKYLKKFSVNSCSDQTEFNDINSAIDTLRRSPAGLDPVLETTLPSGVAYHHAGLTVEEREVVESCYRKGLVRVLTATSTLAAGVNLPARRVIFRQPRIGRDFIDGTRYRQMSGRAGRTGIDTKGESVLICKPEEVKRIMGLINDSCPPLHSCLSEDKNGMTHAILEVVAGGIVQTARDIHRYVRCTLLNSTKPFEDVVKSAQDSLRWLCQKKFLEWTEDTKLYSSTPLGRASFGSSLCPEESLIVLDDLSRAREGFVLASDLHLVYLVTPINVDVEPDWELYYERFMELSPLDQSVGNRVGVQEPFLMRMAHGAPVRTSSRSRDSTKGFQGRSETRHGVLSHGMLSEEQSLRVCKRFYVALILSRLVQEIPVTEVCRAFKVARGMVQALQENAGRFASMVSVFCERLGWHDLEGLVAKFQNRVSFGVRAEIVELTTIPFVKGSRARALYKAGMRTPQAIAESPIPEIAKALFESSAWAAEEGSAQRRIQMGVAKKIKNGARKIVFDKAEEARLAAFSAFKSLGLEISHIPQAQLPAAAGDASRKEGSTSSGEETTSSTILEPGKPISTRQSLEMCPFKDKVTTDMGDDSTKPSDGGLEIPVEASEAGNMHDPKNLAIGGKESATLSFELRSSVNGTGNTEAAMSFLLKETSVGNRLDNKYVSNVKQDPDEKENRSHYIKDTAFEKGPVNAVRTPGGFESFLDLWDTRENFFFDMHFNKRSEFNSIAPFEVHGVAICWENSPVYYINLPKDLFSSENESDNKASANFSSSKKNLLAQKQLIEVAKRRWDRISRILGREDVRKFGWNMKIQIQALKNPAFCVQRFVGLNLGSKSMGLELVDSSYYMFSPIHVKGGVDLCIVAWILWPDEERSSNPNLEKEVKKRLSSEAAAAASRCSRWKNQMRQAAHNGCCRRVALSRALFSVLWKLLTSEELMEALLTIESPLVNILADMELWGIGVDMEGCIRARHLLGRKLKCLEKEAYKLAGMTFSLYATADIANVLYQRLKLPIPEGYNKGKQHPSTDKHCLELLRSITEIYIHMHSAPAEVLALNLLLRRGERHEHPIIPIIKEHRTLAKLLNSTLGSICSLARLSMRTQRYTLHGHWLQTSTATGRLSMEEPNLQCVEHTVDFKMSDTEKGGDTDADNYRISPRDFFVPTQENWLLLAADYSQIELRLMAHFSRDPSLVELLSKRNNDVFRMIAAKWTGKVESSVSSIEREQTKKLIYGILYGMGANTLAEQLECSSEDAAEKIQSFKRSFQGVASWLQEAVIFCRQKGYVETLKGRKRFLANIKFGNSKEKSKAERQAVNSICQGSAADIIKIAMIKLHSALVQDVSGSDSSTSLKRFPHLKGRCRILLQVHDELVLEADPSFVKEAGLLLQKTMESAATLLVPLHVKLQVGKTWGALEPFSLE